MRSQPPHRRKFQEKRNARDRHKGINPVGDVG